MKASLVTLAGMFLLLVTFSNNNKKYPEIKKPILEYYTIKEVVEATEVYKKMDEVEQTIKATTQGINEIKKEKNADSITNK
jgi:hypothetical protein